MPPRSRFRVVLRWFVHVACGLSAAVLVATLVIWVRSYWATDVFNHLSVSGEAGDIRCDFVEIVWGKGQLSLSWQRSAVTLELYGPGWHWVSGDPQEIIPPLPPAWLSRIGFAFQSLIMVPDPRISVWIFASPCWFIALLSAIAPAVWLRGYAKRRRRRVRAARNQCVACGYDLKASPGRCPECGAAALNAH